VPNTLEAVLLGGKLDWLVYTAGYVFTIKPREENVFLSMAERAGATGADRGLALVGFRATPWKPLAVNLSTAFGVDTFNTVFFQAEYTQPLAKDVALTVGAQYHDQRSVGDELIGSFDTWNVGAHARLAFWGASVDVMFHQTGDGADIRQVFGSWPGYLSLINKDFDRADETAWGGEGDLRLRPAGGAGADRLLLVRAGDRGRQYLDRRPGAEPGGSTTST
jgi:outer membrane porin, OprD family